MAIPMPVANGAATKVLGDRIFPRFPCKFRRKSQQPLDVEAAGSSFDKYLQTNLLEISESLQALKLYYEVATMSACETQKNCSMMGCLRLQRIDLPQMDAERNRGNPLLHGHFPSFNGANLSGYAGEAKLICVFDSFPFCQRRVELRGSPGSWCFLGVFFFCQLVGMMHLQQELKRIKFSKFGETRNE